MADINLDVGIRITPDSIRSIQSEVNSAFRNISPTFDVNTSALEAQVQRAVSNFESVATLREFNISQGAISKLQDFVSKNVTVRFSKIEAQRAALERFRKQVEDQAKITLEAQAEAGRARAAAQQTPGTFAGAGDLSGTSSAAENAKAALERAEVEANKLALSEAQLQVATREFARVRVKASSDETRAFTQNIRALRRISDVSADLSAGIIDARQALGQLRNINFNDLNDVGQLAGVTLEAERARIQALVTAADKEEESTRNLARLDAAFRSSQNRLNRAIDKQAAEREKSEAQAQATAEKEALDATRQKTNILRNEVAQLERITGITTASSRQAVAERQFRDQIIQFTRQRAAAEQEALSVARERAQAAARVRPDTRGGGQVGSDVGTRLDQVLAPVVGAANRVRGAFLSLAQRSAERAENLAQVRTRELQTSIQDLTRQLDSIDAGIGIWERELANLNSAAAGSVVSQKRVADAENNLVQDIRARAKAEEDLAGANLQLRATQRQLIRAQAERAARAQQASSSLSFEQAGQAAGRLIVDAGNRAAEAIGGLERSGFGRAGIFLARGLAQLTTRVTQDSQFLQPVKNAADTFARRLQRAGDSTRVLRLRELQSAFQTNRQRSAELSLALSAAASEIQNLTASRQKEAAKRTSDLGAFERTSNLDQAIAVAKKEQADILREAARNTREEARLKREIVSLQAREKAAQELVTRQAEEKARTGGRGGGGGPAGPTGGGGSVISLNTVPREVESSLAKVNRQFAGLATAQDRARATSRALGGELSAGATRAQEFGKQVLLASRRFLAWSVPSQLIFATISRLREAVTTIVELDTQARRLAFFQSAGAGADTTAASLRNLNEAAGGLDLDGVANSADRLGSSLSRVDAPSRRVTDNFNLIIGTARQTGLSLDVVADTLLTVSRVGEDLRSTLGAAGEATDVANGAFVRAATTLQILEGGAISGEEAVRALVAIQAQFTSVNSEATETLRQYGIEAEFAANTANKLAVASANTSANVEELTESARRVGAAFRNVQDLSFDQVLSVISTGFKVTGQSASRLSTALRQISTRAVQNAEDLKQLTGIEIVDPGTGAVKSFESILDVLDRINAAAGTFRAEEIARSIGDQRNLDIILGLANASDQLRENFERLGTTQGRLANAAEAARLAQGGVAEVSEGLQAQINRLDTAFTALIESEGSRELFASLISGATQLVEGFSEIAKQASVFKPIVAGIAAIGLGKLVITAIQFAKGISRSVSESSKLVRERKEALKLLEAEKTRLDGLNALEQQGVITKRQAAEIQLRSFKISQSLQRNQARLNALQNQELALDKNSKNFETERLNIEERRKIVQEQINRLKVEENALLNQANQQATQGGTRVGRLRGGATALAAGLGGALLTLGPEIEKTIESRTLKGAAAGLGQGLTLAASVAGATGPLGQALIVAATVAAQAYLASIEEGIAEAEKKGRQLSARGQVSRLSAAARELQAEGKLAEDVARLRAKSLDDRGIENALASELTTQVEKEALLTEKKARAAGVATKLKSDEINTVKAQLTELAKVREEEEGRNKRAEEQRRRQSNIKGTLAEIDSILARTLGKENNVNRTLNERKRLEEAFARLEQNGFSRSQQRELIERKRAEAQERSARAARAESAVTNRLKVAAEALTSAFGLTERQTLDIKFQIDQQALDREFNTIQKRIAEIRKTPILDAKQAADAQKEIAKLQDKQEKINVSRLQGALQRQQRVVNVANKALQSTARQFESSSRRIESGLRGVVKEQAALAKLFDDIGQRAAQRAERSGQRIASFLEDTGADLQTRLLAVRESAQRQISQIAAAGNRQLSTLGQGFDTGAQLAGVTDRLVGLIGAAANRGLDEVFNKQTGVFDRDLLRLRTGLRQERAIFQIRVRNSQREIQIRQNILNREIQAIEQRIQAERELQQLRLEQEREFGNLIIQGPKEFNKVARDVGASASFFKGVTDINIDSLRTLIGRARGARGRGQFNLLQAVQRGLESSQRLGLDSPVQGIGAQQLSDIFLKAQFKSAESILADLQRQQKELEGQTELQKQAEARRKELEALQEISVDIQQALLRVSQADAAAAIQQRDEIKAKLDEQSKTQVAELQKLVDVGLGTLRGLGTLASAQSAATFTGRVDPVADKARAEIDRFRESISKQVAAVEEARKKNTAADTAKAKASSDAAAKISGFGTAIGSALEVVRTGVGGRINPTIRTGGPSDNTVGASVLDQSRVFQEIGSSLNILKSGRLQIVSPELRKLREVVESTGGTREQRNRLRKLESQARRTVGGASGSEQQGRVAARRILKDRQASQRIEQSFRTLLQDRAGGVETQFVRQLRELRGEGRRGAARVDTDALRRLLGQQGLGGVAQNVSTSRRGAAIIDRLLRLSDELSENQKTLSREAGREIKKILGSEIAEGVRDLKNLISEAQQGIKDVGEREEARQNVLADALKNFSIAAPEDVARLGKDIRKAFNEASDDVNKRLESAGTALGKKLSAAIEGTDLTLRIPENEHVNIALSVNLANAITSQDFGRQLAEQLKEAGISDPELNSKIVRQLITITKPLIEKGLVTASPDFVSE